MAEIILISGGCRSGKSRYAEELTQQSGSKILYIATAPVFDLEMQKRVELHQQARAGKGWDTIEEELDLNTIFKNNINYNGILVDCLTLWINNLMYHYEKQDITINEAIITDKVREFLTTLNYLNLRVVLVINEVGMGVVPENPLTRLFRDLSGRCSQLIAQAADQVYFMSCGIPLKLK